MIQQIIIKKIGVLFRFINCIVIYLIRLQKGLQIPLSTVIQK